MNRYTSVFVAFSFVSLVFLGACSQTENTVSAIISNDVNSSTTLLATIAENEKPQIPRSASGHSKSIPADQKNDLFYIDFNQHGTGVAYLASVGDQTRVVLNGKPLRLHQRTNLASLLVSPDGKRAVYAAVTDKKWYIVLDGRETGPFDEVGPPVFSPDSRHVAYEVRKGDVWNIVVDNSSSVSATSYYDKPLFSADSSKLMYIENTTDDQKKRYVVCTTRLVSLANIPAIAQPCAISGDKRRIAVVNERQGKNVVTEFGFDNPTALKQGPLYDSIRHLALNADGTALSYIAKRGTESYLVLNGKEERLPEGETPWPPVIRPDNRGAGIIISGKKGAYLHQAFYTDGIKPKRYKEAAELEYSKDGVQQAHGAIKDEKFIAVVNGVEGPLFDRVIAPKFSPDGKYVVYRARNDDMRFVVVTDSKGVVLRQHPGYERVFEPVFTADGKSVAYGVKDGNKLWWKVEKL